MGSTARRATGIIAAGAVALAAAALLVAASQYGEIALAVSLWDDESVLIPCGHSPSPDVGGEVLRRVFALADGDVALILSLIHI